MSKLVLLLIRYYQKYLNWIWGSNTCRFSPTCSEYCYEAISKYGMLSGAFKGLSRILRCHQWSPGGYDPA